MSKVTLVFTKRSEVYGMRTDSGRMSISLNHPVVIQGAGQKILLIRRFRPPGHSAGICVHAILLTYDWNSGPLEIEVFFTFQGIRLGLLVGTHDS